MAHPLKRCLKPLFIIAALHSPQTFSAELTGAQLPEFSHQSSEDWLQSPPLTTESLKGNVLLIDFWTFECWNCYRSFPWLNALHKKYTDQGLVVIGVHSPEFKHERDRDRVRQKAKEFKLNHPIMIDNDFSYWKALKNRYWPTFYLVDRAGRLRFRHIGETHAGDANARAIERNLRTLLDE